MPRLRRVARSAAMQTAAAVPPYHCLDLALNLPSRAQGYGRHPKVFQGGGIARKTE